MTLLALQPYPAPLAFRAAQRPRQLGKLDELRMERIPEGVEARRCGFGDGGG
jgi:hypothetical protein